MIESSSVGRKASFARHQEFFGNDLLSGLFSWNRLIGEQLHDKRLCLLHGLCFGVLRQPKHLLSPISYFFADVFGFEIIIANNFT